MGFVFALLQGVPKFKNIDIEREMVIIAVRIVFTSRVEDGGGGMKGRYGGFVQRGGGSVTIINSYKGNVIFAWDCPSLSLKLG